MQRSGSSPAAISRAASVERVQRAQIVGLVRHGHRVQVDDAEDRLAAVALLVGDVVADRAEPGCRCASAPVGWMPEKTRVMGSEGIRSRPLLA